MICHFYRNWSSQSLKTSQEAFRPLAVNSKRPMEHPWTNLLRGVWSGWITMGQFTCKCSLNHVAYSSSGQRSTVFGYRGITYFLADVSSSVPVTVLHSYGVWTDWRHDGEWKWSISWRDVYIPSNFRYIIGHFLSCRKEGEGGKRVRKRKVEGKGERRRKKRRGRRERRERLRMKKGVNRRLGEEA